MCLFRYLCSERALKGEDDSCLIGKGDTLTNIKGNERDKQKIDVKMKEKDKNAKNEL